MNMAKEDVLALPAEVGIINRIYVIRDQKVMIDRDLAELYGVETKRLKESVRRHKARFPKDFMFEMSKEEFEIWRTHFASSKQDRQGLRYRPFCFTEQGLTMLSCVLNSERAIAVNIQIVRVFTKMREMLLTYKDILLKLEQMEKNLIRQDGRMRKHEEDIQLVFQALRKLFNPPSEPRPKIGFRRKNEDQ